MVRFYDKKLKQIKEGMTLRHNDGSEAKVQKCWCVGSETLGFNVTDVGHIHGQVGLVYTTENEFMPLSDFTLREWVIISEKDELNPVAETVTGSFHTPHPLNE